MSILKARYGSQNCVINAHKKILMNGKLITDTIAHFVALSNDLKSFHSIFVHYGVTSKYFSSEVVQHILHHRLTKNTCREFTNFMNLKRFINDPVVHLSKLTNWINDKITFWCTYLGSNILAQNAPRGVNVRRSLAVSTSEQRSNVSRMENEKFFYRNESSARNRPIS